MNTIQECSFHECANRNEIDISLKEIFRYEDEFMEFSKKVLENLQYLPLLLHHCPLQLVVLDGRIINCLLYTKIITKQFKIFYHR